MYEIDVIGVSADQAEKDADAMAMRWYDESYGRYIVGVFDGGLKAHGEELARIMKTYYSSGGQKPYIDFIICSHPHEDHAVGLRTILEEFDVGTLYVNCPWDYVDDVWNTIHDGRRTKESVKRYLREKYSYIDALEQLAVERGVPVREIFQGDIIMDRLYVLSPSREFFLEQLVASDKTEIMDASESAKKSSFIAKITRWIQTRWGQETLREGEKTSAENEMSTVVFCDLDGETVKRPLLLVGDAGPLALTESMDYAAFAGIDLRTVCRYQIPHHGGRHNLTPTVMNRLVGTPVEEGKRVDKSAIVSVAAGSDHPKKAVTNAFIRRGVRVFKTAGVTVNIREGMRKRSGWKSVAEEKFSNKIESWDD